MILQRLREETRADHERLESHIDLLGRSWSPNFYRQLLSKFFGFYAALEPSVFSFPDWRQTEIKVSDRLKLPSLETDLHKLGLSNEAIAQLPRCAQTPSLENFAAALGAAYVMEGSTLGGQIISRHLRQVLDLGEAGGLAFFGYYGSNVGPMWKQFTTVLDGFQGDDAQNETLVRTAILTFRTFDSWLSDIL